MSHCTKSNGGYVLLSHFDKSPPNFIVERNEKEHHRMSALELRVPNIEKLMKCVFMLHVLLS